MKNRTHNKNIKDLSIFSFLYVQNLSHAPVRSHIFLHQKSAEKRRLTNPYFWRKYCSFQEADVAGVFSVHTGEQEGIFIPIVRTAFFVFEQLAA